MFDCKFCKNPICENKKSLKCYSCQQSFCLSEEECGVETQNGEKGYFEVCLFCDKIICYECGFFMSVTTSVDNPDEFEKGYMCGNCIYHNPMSVLIVASEIESYLEFQRRNNLR